MLYKINHDQINPVGQTKFSRINKVEKDLEDWIEGQPEILGEKLLIIGRQVLISEVNDRIDLLAVDSDGNLVIIELKKDNLKSPVDVQSLRYASYVSRWDYNDIENQASSYFQNQGNKDFNFNEKFENFCRNSNMTEIPDLNQDQRIIIVGDKLKEKLGSVALWLLEHSIDIKIVELALFNDKNQIFLSPKVIIPAPTTTKYEIGKYQNKKTKPWLTDGENWHLNKRCGKEMKNKLIQLNNLIIENFEEIEGPVWDQKYYLSYKYNSTIFLFIDTFRNALKLNVLIKNDNINLQKVAEQLGVKVFDKNSSLSEKLQLESSIEMDESNSSKRFAIRIKEDFDINSDGLLKLLKDALKSIN